MAELMKNIKKSKVLTLKDEISYADGQDCKQRHLFRMMR